MYTYMYICIYGWLCIYDGYICHNMSVFPWIYKFPCLVRSCKGI